jgi:hypothetical protein
VLIRFDELTSVHVSLWFFLSASKTTPIDIMILCKCCVCFKAVIRELEDKQLEIERLEDEGKLLLQLSQGDGQIITAMNHARNRYKAVVDKAAVS